MPQIRISVADVEIRLDGPDFAQLLAAASVLLVEAAAVDRDQAEELEERPALGFTSTLDLDPDRERRADPVWYSDEE